MRKCLVMSGFVSVVLAAGCAGSGPAAYSTEGVRAVSLASAGGGTVGVGHLGTGVGLLFPDDRRAGNSWFADVNFNLNIRPDMSLELGASYFALDIESAAPAYSGTLQCVPLTVTAQYGGPFGTGKERWFVELGIGWSVNNFDGAGIDADDALVFAIGGGAEMAVRDILRVSVGLKYLLGDADLSGSVTDIVDMDAWILRANVSYMF